MELKLCSKSPERIGRANMVENWPLFVIHLLLKSS